MSRDSDVYMPSSLQCAWFSGMSAVYALHSAIGAAGALINGNNWKSLALFFVTLIIGWVSYCVYQGAIDRKKAEEATAPAQPETGGVGQ
jgi:hypothetical protein